MARQQVPRAVRRRTRGTVRVPLWLAAAVAVVVLAVLGLSVWRSVRSDEPSGTVRIDVDKLRENVRQNGFGRRGR